MKAIKARLDGLIDLIHSIREKNLKWQSANLGQQLQLSHERVLAKKNLTAELSKKNVQLAHDIDLLKTRQAAELDMLKMRCKEDIKDYQHYLDSLSVLKKEIQASFPRLPDAMACTIHHHAKSLLNSIWEAEDDEKKRFLESQLINLMTTMHEEARQYGVGTITETLPEKTLQLISQSPKLPLPH